MLADGNGDFTKARRPRARRQPLRHGPALAALFADRQGRRGRAAQRRSRAASSRSRRPSTCWSSSSLGPRRLARRSRESRPSLRFARRGAGRLVARQRHRTGEPDAYAPASGVARQVDRPVTAGPAGAWASTCSAKRGQPIWCGSRRSSPRRSAQAASAPLPSIQPPTTSPSSFRKGVAAGQARRAGWPRRSISQPVAACDRRDRAGPAARRSCASQASSALVQRRGGRAHLVDQRRAPPRRLPCASLRPTRSMAWMPLVPS